MPDFGVAGKLTIREYDGAVKVKVSEGEYLYFRLTVQGAEPIFTFACKHKARLSEHEFDGHPKKMYEWTWSKGQNQSDLPMDMYAVGMSFITAIRYTLWLEHRDKNDVMIDLVKDVDYESNHAADNYTETLRVLTA